MNRTDKEIIEKLLNGWTLKTLMEPDSSIGTEGQTHLENLKLKSIIIKDNTFWGITLHHHLAITSHDYKPLSSNLSCMSFLYTNLSAKRFFFGITENLSTHQYLQSIGPISRYKFHQFVLLNDYEEIFNLKQSNNKSLLENAIRDNDDLKCALLDVNGYWHICNIHIPYFVYETGKIYLQSEPFKKQPGMFSNEWIKMLEEKGEEILHKIKHESNIIGGGARLDGPIFHGQYVIDADGQYTDTASENKETWVEAHELKIFKKKLPDGIEKVRY